MIDHASIDSMFKNPHFVSHIKPVKSDSKLKLVSNGDYKIFEKAAHLKLLLMQVWFNPSSLTSVLALCDKASLPGFRDAMESNESKSALSHKPHRQSTAFE